MINDDYESMANNEEVNFDFEIPESWAKIPEFVRSFLAEIMNHLWDFGVSPNATTRRMNIIPNVINCWGSKETALFLTAWELLERPNIYIYIEKKKMKKLGEAQHAEFWRLMNRKGIDEKTDYIYVNLRKKWSEM
jgi:hypothetical protein